MPPGDDLIARSEGERSWHSRFATRWLLTLFAVALAAWFGLMSGRGAGHVPAVWWANSVLLAAVLLARRSHRWHILAAGYLGNVLAHLVMHDPISQVLLLSLIDTGETTFAVIALQWPLPGDNLLPRMLSTSPSVRFDLTERSRLLRFVVFAVLLGPLLAGALAGIVLHALVGAESITALRWFPPSTLGMAIVTPLLLGLARPETRALFAPRRLVKTLVWLSLLAITTLAIFSRGQFPWLFLIFPPLMLLVVELGVGGGVLGACVVAVIGSVYTISGHGAFAQDLSVPLEHRILILQLFLATAVLSVDVVGLVLGDLKRSAIVEEHARLELSSALNTLEEVARIDVTTHVANRRRFEEVLEDEWLRAARHQTTISLLLLDVDRFKSYNDLYGHVAGDECLRKIADLTLTALHRPGDLLARFGGEEFAIILPLTPLEGASEIAEVICRTVQNACIQHDGSPDGCVTVSLGCMSAVPERGQPAITLVRAADSALYQAKREGRNRVVVAESAHRSPENSLT